MTLMSKTRFTFQHYQYGSEPGQSYNSEPYIIYSHSSSVNKQMSLRLKSTTSYFQFDTHFSAVSITHININMHT